ncbi:site-specific integrase [Myxococcota bacterium]|nr:site-specific integrase [Myxococcota bacterium]
MTRARRGRGEGGIYQRADGRWCASISIGADENGKRRRRVLYGETKREVQDKLREAQTKGTNIALPAPQRLKLGAFLDGWLRDCRGSGELRESTEVRYRSVIDRHIKPHLGGVALSGLTTLHVQRLYTVLEESNVPGRTREIVHAVLRRALQQAIEWKQLAVNPCDAAIRPKAKKTPRVVWTAEQARAFLDAIRGDRLSALYVLAITTGARQGELLGLAWDRVDLDAGRVRIDQQLVEVRGKLSLSELKTKESRRVLPIGPVAVTALREHRRRMLEELRARIDRSEGTDRPLDDLTERRRQRQAEDELSRALVFVDSQGGPLRKSNILRRSFDPLIARAGVPRIVFHALRHSCATMLLEAGEDFKTVQELLGHTSPTTTLMFYAHSTEGRKREAAAKLDAILGPK